MPPHAPSNGQLEETADVVQAVKGDGDRREEMHCSKDKPGSIILTADVRLMMIKQITHSIVLTHQRSLIHLTPTLNIFFVNP